MHLLLLHVSAKHLRCVHVYLIRRSRLRSCSHPTDMFNDRSHLTFRREHEKHHVTVD